MTPAPHEPQRQLNAFAIVSFVFGVMGGVLFSVIFGVIALKQIKWRGERGRGFAVAGLWISGAWVFICVGGILAMAIFSSTVDKSAWPPASTAPVTISDEDIRVGDCLNNFRSDDDPYIRVDCQAPHEAEIFALVPLDKAAQYPGLDALSDQTGEKCKAAFADYSDRRRGDGTIDFHWRFPSKKGWEAGDHIGTCAVVAVSGDLTGSVRKG